MQKSDTLVSMRRLIFKPYSIIMFLTLTASCATLPSAPDASTALAETVQDIPPPEMDASIALAKNVQDIQLPVPDDSAELTETVQDIQAPVPNNLTLLPIARTTIYIRYFPNFLSSVAPPPVLPNENARNITPPPQTVFTRRGIKNADELTRFFLANNPSEKYSDIKTLAEYYISEAAAENINSDLAFVQMCLETGFLRFGSLVTRNMNNFCGLGAIDINYPGLSFESIEIGVRAHIQHLHAYGTTGSLRKALVDPRYDLVRPHGKAKDVLDLSGTWASDPEYGKKLITLLERLYAQ